MLETDPAYTRMLEPLFAIEDIQLKVVTVPVAFVHHAPAFALLLIDASGGREEDLLVVADTIRQVAAPVHVFHPREHAVRHLQTVLEAAVIWLPADFQVISMRDILHLLKVTHDGFHAEHPLDRLTRREQEIRDLMVEGLSYRDIGAMLLVTKSTIATTARRLMRKLEVSDRKQLVKSAESTRSVLHRMYEAPPEERMTNRMTKFADFVRQTMTAYRV